jgi:predicted transcriptional regulator
MANHRIADNPALLIRTRIDSSRKAALRLLENDAHFVEAVLNGEAALQRGEFLTHEQMGDRLRRLLQP